MAYEKLTDLGKKFITYVCTKGGTNLLSGQKREPLPYTKPPLLQTWTCDITDPQDANKKITNGTELANALIYWFNTYAQEYELDANVIAAQAYAESNYIMWTYASNSAASGVNQFTMLTIFGIIVENHGKSTRMTPNEIAVITNGLTKPLSRNSYDVDSKDYTDAFANRPILQQNVIDNPGIMIKAQCRYMKNIANDCGSLTSTSLFCYSRGPAYLADTYSKAIQKCVNKKGQDPYTNEGLNYVLKIFGILGDKDNWLESKGITRGYKPKGLYFGYDDQMGDSPKNLRLKMSWDSFAANVTESDEYNLKGYDTDIVVKELSKEPKYKFIYYPEQDYKTEATNKTQIVLHHTVSGDNIAGDIRWWESQVQKTGDKVATAFIVGRRGEIFQLFSTEYWAYHLGISDTIIADNNLPGSANRTLNEQSVGIEIDSWGGLIEDGGYYYPATSDDYSPQQFFANKRVDPIPAANVVQYTAPTYPKGFHGFYAFERYTDAQILAVKKIIQAVKTRFADIPLEYVNDRYSTNMWGTYNAGTNKWSPSLPALQGKPGIWTHVSYRYDKSDCHPQPQLIDMLKSL